MNIETKKISLGDIDIDVIQKNIKNVHLSVHPPTGRVRISAPERMNLDTIRLYAISKIHWIRKHQTKLRKQEREAPREYISGESHYFLGKRYLLKVVEHSMSPSVVLKHSIIELYIRKNTNTHKRQAILEEWYRKRIKEIVPKYISMYEEKMRVSVREWGIKKMKTKWGTCSITAKRIWLNLELAKKPLHCLEYVIVHEMVHLLERKHNERFIAYMDRYMSQWKAYKEELNRFPVSHAEWSY